jgi:cytochrome oxidase Cu insertion factor (SCO1/SenC/PrrC family)
MVAARCGRKPAPEDLGSSCTCLFAAVIPQTVCRVESQTENIETTGHEKEDTMPKEGSKAPAFCLPSADEDQVCLKDFAGKWVVLYFYPKDSTSG